MEENDCMCMLVIPKRGDDKGRWIRLRRHDSLELGENMVESFFTGFFITRGPRMSPIKRRETA